MSKKLNKVQKKIELLESTHDMNTDMINELTAENDNIECKLHKLYEKEKKLEQQ